jgi:hypothetical protein
VRIVSLCSFHLVGAVYAIDVQFCDVIQCCLLSVVLYSID